MVGDGTVHFELGADGPTPVNDTWRAWSNPLTRRDEAYLAIWQALRPLRDQERNGGAGPTPVHFQKQWIFRPSPRPGHDAS